MPFGYPYPFLILIFYVATDAFAETSTIINFAVFENVADAFTTLMRLFTEELCKADFDTIQTVCLMRADKQLCRKICKTKSIHDLFKLLKSNSLYFNWMKVEYLQTMAIAAGNKRLQGILKDYEDIVLSKTLGEIWNFIPSFQRTRTKYYNKVKAKFHGEDPDNIKIKDLQKFKPKFAKKIAQHIVQINTGSLTITWYILAEETYQAYLFALDIPKGLRNDDCL